MREASYAIGGPWGRLAVAAGSWWTPLRWLLVMASFTMMLGFVQKSPCADGNWTSGLQYTHACYSDIIPLWDTEGLSSGEVPYRDHLNEYPVLTGGFMWLTALATDAGSWFGDVNEVELFGILSAALLGLCGLVAVGATVQAAGHRPYDAAIFALSPLLMFHAFTNWDLFAMMFACCALWAWSRERPVISGVLIGLGAAAKLYPALLLVPLLILALRTRRWREPLLCTGSAALAWLAVNVPIALAYRDGWLEFFRLNDRRGVEPDTLWFIWHYVSSGDFYAPFASYRPSTWAVALTLLAGLCAIATLGLLCREQPRLAQLAFLVVVVFLLTSKVWSRQYSLWLLPLLALARPRWRAAILWQLTEIALWFAYLLWLLGPDKNGVDVGMVVVATVVRDTAVAFLALLVVRDMLRPELDVVRRRIPVVSGRPGARGWR